jgi:hypothetical protein
MRDCIIGSFPPRSPAAQNLRRVQQRWAVRRFRQGRGRANEREVDLGFGRVVASGTEAPNMLAVPV